MRRLGVVWGVVFLVAGSVHAAGASKKPVKADAAEQAAPAPGPIQAVPDLIRVRVGSGNVITFPSRVLRVAVGDQKIVAIHVVEAKQVLLQGLAPGRSTVFAWLSDGRRLKYDLIVSPRMEVLESALHDLDPHIEVEQNADGASLVLSGQVKDERVANAARLLAENMLGNVAGGASRVISLLQFPGSNDADLRLKSALGDVDPRIRLRRIQVGNKVSNAADAVVLEGRVKDISSLVRAITLAELQLGGVGGKIEPLSPEIGDRGRNRNFTGTLQKLQSEEPAPSGLAAYVARGLILKSASGRVLSFLEVDDLPQIMVNIRVLQVDRGRARHMGIDYRLDGARFSVGSFQQPGQTPVSTNPSSPPSIASLVGGNVVATFVDKTIAIAAAIDFLQQKDLARSVAEPNITTLSGEQASVLIGGEVPIPTTTVGQSTSVQGFLFQDFGVRLDIRPTLAPNGLVAMEISPSIIKPSADLSVSGVPGFNVQSVQTTAKVAPGQTLVLGGLISFTEESQKRGVPGFSDIPLLKHLFSWEGRTLQEQEILFVITPRILSEHADDVADALQWRDVEPLPAGTTVELPPLDAEIPRTLTSATLTPSGMPPSFWGSSPTRPAHAPASKSGEATPSPASTALVANAPSENTTSKETTPSAPASVTPQKEAAASVPSPAAPKKETAPGPAVLAVPQKETAVSVPSPAAPKKETPPSAVTAAPQKETTPSVTAHVAAQKETTPGAPAPATPQVVKNAAPPSVESSIDERVTTSPLAPERVSTAAHPANASPKSSLPPARADLQKPAQQEAPKTTPTVAAAATTTSTASAAVPTPKPPQPASSLADKKSATAHDAPKPVAAAPKTARASITPATTPPPPIAHETNRGNDPISQVQVTPEIRASVTRDYQIVVVVSPHPGDAWSRLARRLTGNGSHWRQLAALNGNTSDTLTAAQKVHVPFEMLRPEIKQQIVATLFPKGSAAENDWNRVVAAGQTKK
ncbi:MAG TPA: pilus assembly protein N-terminal domain-containing protein [Thermoanaerobaculia bacterium]|nr:pilus assembly protein N-terminal domain-containing protein [Thermoanaerobaculia bacterium]